MLFHNESQQFDRFIETHLMRIVLVRLVFLKHNSKVGNDRKYYSKDGKCLSKNIYNVARQLIEKK